MDRLVTFFGYISSYVASSRRNGRNDEDNSSNAKSSRKSQESSNDSGFNSTKEELKGESSGVKKLNRSKTSAFTESSLDTLRGEVREIKPSPVRCDGFQNDSLKKSAKMNVFSDKSSTIFPPVDRHKSSSTNARIDGIKTSVKDENLATPSFQGLNNSHAAGTLPSAYRQPEELLSKEAHPGKGNPRKNKDLRRTKGLPNIFSNVGKSFVETNQLAVFDRASFRKKPAGDKEPVVPVGKPAMEDGSRYGNEQKSRMEVMEVPKAKKKKKKSKGKGRKDEQHGQEQCRNAQEGGVKECDEGISRQSEQERKLAEKATAEDTEGMKNNSRRQRPGTALGRWIKRRSNTVAPAPLDDSISEAKGCAQTKEQGSLVNKERVDKDAFERGDFCPSTTPCVTTVLVSECHENVSILMPKGEPRVNPEEDVPRNICNEKVPEQVDESPSNMVKDEETCSTKPTKEEIPLRVKATPIVPSKEQEKKAFPEEASDCNNTKREESSTGKVPPPCPVKRDLLKETLENISLAALNDTTQQPKVSMKKELNIKKVERPFYDMRKQHVETWDQEPMSSALDAGFDGNCENVERAGFESRSGAQSPNLRENSVLMPCKTILVKQRPVKTERKKSIAEDSSKVKRNREHDTKRIAVESSPRDSCIDARKVAFQSDSNFQSSETFEIKKGVVSSQPIREGCSLSGKSVVQTGLPYLTEPKNQNRGAMGKSLCRTTANPMFPLLGPNQASRQASIVLPTSSLLLDSEQCASTSTFNTAKKPKWIGAKPCLPSIKPERKQTVETFLDKCKSKHQKEREDDFESWGEHEEPEEVKRILERPLTARLPRYPAHWEPLPNERPPGRGGQEYCLGVLWKKPEKSFLSESSNEGK